MNGDNKANNKNKDDFHQRKLQYKRRKLHQLKRKARPGDKSHQKA